MEKNIEKFSQNKKYEIAEKKMDNIRDQFMSNSKDILKIDSTIIDVENKFTKAISEANDRNIVNILEKNKREKINELEKDKLAKSAEMDELRSSYWDLDDILKETTEKINTIESEYSEKIDSKVQEVIKKGEYYESKADVERYYSKLKKFIKAYKKAEALENSIQELLEDDELISKDDKRELKKRAWDIKKRRVIYSQVIRKYAKERKNEKEYFQSVKKTISKLISLKK